MTWTRGGQTLLCLALGACAVGNESPDVLACPPLVVAAREGVVSHGAVAMQSAELVPGTCATVLLDGARLSHGAVTPERTLALGFAARGDLRGRSVQLRLSSVEGRGGARTYQVPLGESLRGRIGYPPGSLPVVATEGGELRFSGWVEGDEIEELWIANWNNGAVRTAEPTPLQRMPFEGSVRGQPPECASPVSRHALGTGGCYFPRGGGECSPPCTREDLAAGRCSSGECVRSRGCLPLDVDERSSGAPGPALEFEIPIGSIDGGGARDGGVSFTDPEAGPR